MTKTLILLAGSLLIAGGAAAQPAPRMEHPQMREIPVPASEQRARTAEQLRAGSAWGSLGGMSGEALGEFTGVGGPDELEEMRFYPVCRSRREDRCHQGR